jgi:hypothetical protein
VHLGAENVRSGRMKKVDNLAKDAMFV